jgi:hypothetical protein
MSKPTNPGARHRGGRASSSLTEPEHMPRTGGTDGDHVAGTRLPTISDEVMRGRLGKAHPYTAVLLRKTAKFVRPDVDPVVWEHGRRNMALGEHGMLAIVLPVDNDPGDWAGLGIFTASLEEVREIMDYDPGVLAGIFSYELHPVRGFPGSCLPDSSPGGSNGE